MTKLFLSALFLILLDLPAAQAQVEVSACYKNEYNDRTKKVFTSSDEYNETLYNWYFNAPPQANPLALIKAYKLYKIEEANSVKLGNDKRAHCYIGCRIAQVVNFKTADYVGWIKEESDLRDCNLNTRFEEKDYLATRRGAEIGEQQSDPAICRTVCKDIY